AWQGVGPAVRMAEFVVVPALVALVAAMALALPMTDLGRLRPVLAHGWNPVFRAVVTLVGHAQGMDAALLLFPWLSRKRGVWKTALTIVLIRSTAYLILLVVPVLVLGVPDTIREVLPVLAVVRNLELRGAGLERIDSLFTSMWLLASYLPLAFRLYLSASGLARLFGQTNHRPFLWPVLAVVTVGAALPFDLVAFERFHQALGYLGLAALMGAIPLLAAGALVWRWRRDALRAHT
ncbi:MAG: GerAB/ArcD/ProY family transporter, partial [Chitinophagales bacterium]